MGADAGAGGRHAAVLAPGDVEIEQDVPGRLAEEIGGQVLVAAAAGGVELARGDGVAGDGRLIKRRGGGRGEGGRGRSGRGADDGETGPAADGIAPGGRTAHGTYGHVCGSREMGWMVRRRCLAVSGGGPGCLGRQVRRQAW